MDEIKFTINDGIVNFKLNAEKPEDEPVVTSDGFDYTLDFVFQ